VDGADRISLLGARRPKRFRLRTLILQPLDAIDYHPADWLGTFVVVERGELEVECRRGGRARFREGAVLVFAGLALQRLRNASRLPLVLSALSRIRSVNCGDLRSSDESSRRGASHK
jgi:hypothetical protein